MGLMVNQRRRRRWRKRLQPDLSSGGEELYEENKILGKALGAGVLPVSAILSDKDVMLCFRLGEHGSTFGGNPLASAVAIAALDVVKEEKLTERAASMGQEFRNQLTKVQDKFPDIIKDVRGRGLCLIRSNFPCRFA